MVTAAKDLADGVAAQPLNVPAATPRLRRMLSLSDLLIYGMVIVTPMSPMPTFGLLSERGRGHVVTAILLACVAMLCTAISYGRMARAYPSAGSAFTYVAQEIHPSLGYVTGWGILLDYGLTSLFCILWSAEESAVLFHGVPLYVWKVLYVAIFVYLNVQAIRSSARVNTALAGGQGVVVAVLLVAAVHYLLVHPFGTFSAYTRPFYDPTTFTSAGLLGCTSIAVMSYLGFDAISTLSEETKNPRRNILLATVMTCVITGIIAGIEVYVAQLVWPASEAFPDVDTAFVWVSGRIWQPLFAVLGIALLVSTLGSGVAAHLSSARLLYAMGRSNALPRKFFGAIDPRHHIPRHNVLLVGVILLVGVFALEAGVTAQAVNFGALVAFIGVNAAAFLRFYVRAAEKRFWNAAPHVAGFLICLTLLWNISGPAKIVGSCWMLAGIALGAWRTRGFRLPLALEAPEE
jgi:amino acid transporter